MKAAVRSVRNCAWSNSGAPVNLKSTAPGTDVPGECPSNKDAVRRGPRAAP